MRRSSGGGLFATRRLMAVLALTAGLAALAPAGAAAAARPRHQLGALPAFPRVRGVIPPLGSPAALRAHESLVRQAFAAVRARTLGEPLPSPEFPGCPELFFFTQDVCYQGGPVLRDPTVHLIFWQGQIGGGVKSFPAGYETTVERYFEDVAHDSGLTTNVFSVDPEYGESKREGEYASSFGKAADVAEDLAPFPENPSNACDDFAAGLVEGPCLLDQDIRNEVREVAEAHGWQLESLKDVFLVLTPPGVGSCIGEGGGCAYFSYCGYHSDFGGNGEYLPPGDQTVYAMLPFPLSESGCDSGAHPNSASDNGADAVIDDASHELNESITDPLGSQCNEAETVCEPFSWTDAIGQEIADKCLPPETTIAGIYGEPIGGTSASNVYNQVIDGDHYFTQRVWSNAAGFGEGGCVQRLVNAQFSSAGGQASTPVRFDGSASGGAGDEIAYWEWDFGDGTLLATTEPVVSHTYAKAGVYEVTLAAFDVYGNANTVTQTVEVQPFNAPSPGSEEHTTVTTTVTSTTGAPPAAITHLSAKQLAARLGLPRQGARLAGAGTIALGRASCPPACGVRVRLLASTGAQTRGHRSGKRRLVGSLHISLADGGTRQITLALNALGRTLLHRAHTLKVTLELAAEDQQGASWTVVRSLTLSSSGKASHAAR
jgi:PKD domain